jgi:tetratricopeptide (TPR) repeat protein
MGEHLPDAAASQSLQHQARAMQELGEWNAAALAVNDAILAADANDEAALVRRGRCLRALGRVQEALALFEALAAARPADSVVRSQHAKTARLDRARRRAEQLMSADPRKLFDELEGAKNAERDLDFQIEGRRLLARRDRTIEAACALAAAQRRARDLDGALNTYRWAWRQDGSPRSNAMAHTGLAAVLRDLKRLAEAERILRGVLAVNERDAFARLGLAGVLMDRVEHQGQRGLVTEIKRLLDAVWARGTRDTAVQAAYHRLASLT